jgi:glucose/arabinose dehydrogenase
VPARIAAIALLLACCSGCFRLQPSAGGGQVRFTPPRAVHPEAVAVPSGYRVDVVATGLTFPTGVAFDDAGRVYVTEAGYSYGEVWTTPRVLRIDGPSAHTVVATGARNGPWNGLDFHDGALFVAEGGALEGGRILRVTLDGEVGIVVDGLPSQGDHHTNGPVAGRDGWLYFGQGTVTNAGIVGADNADFGWLRRQPRLHDVPCHDVALTGERVRGPDALGAGRGAVETGAFAPYGTALPPGSVVRGAVPCNGAVLRVRPRGGAVELVASGFRNPFGLAFGPNDRLFVADNGYDDRGSRPVHGAGDLLWAVHPGAWHGWPDFSGDRALDDGDHFVPPGRAAPRPLLARHPSRPPRPAAVLGVHASANGLDFARGPDFGFAGQAFVAEFGDQAPAVGKVLGPVGFKVVRVDVTTGVVADFAVNRGSANGPASRIGGGGLERPIAARFDPSGTALYVVDFGVLGMTAAGAVPHRETGVLWRITRGVAR